MSGVRRPLVLVGPSGVGKTTIAEGLIRGYPGRFALSVSATSRRPRAGERPSREYRFVTRPEFEEMIDAGKLAEWAEVHGEYYGTPLENLTGVSSDTRPVLDIDVQGARQIMTHGIGALVIFILPPGPSEWLGRLVGRGTESKEQIACRLRTALDELGAAPSFEQFVVNGDLDQAVQRVLALASGDADHGSVPVDVNALCRELEAGARSEIGRLEGARAAPSTSREKT